MVDEIDNIIRNSDKGELLEALVDQLVDADKVIVVLLTDEEEGKYHSCVLTLGIPSTYEAIGILDVAKQDLIADYLPINP